MSNSLENSKTNPGSTPPVTTGQTLKLAPSPTQASAKPAPAPAVSSVAASIPKTAPAPATPAPTPTQSVAASIPQSSQSSNVKPTVTTVASAMPALGNASSTSVAPVAASQSTKSPTAQAALSSLSATQPKPAPVAASANTGASADSAAKDVTFRSENIGKWAARQENPFAEQNRKTAARKKKQKENIRKARPYIFTVGIVAVIVVAAVLGIMLIASIINRPSAEIPNIAGSTFEDVTNYKDLLHKIYQENNDNPESIDEAVAETLKTSEGKEFENEVRLAQMLFYQDNNQADKVNEIGDMIQPDQLSIESQLRYYNSLYYGAKSDGDESKANEYLNIIYDIANEIGGEGA